MKRSRLLAALIIVLAMIASPMTAAATRSGDGQHLEGSWVLTATIEGQPLIHALITFNRDGSFIETAAAPGVSTGHGAWSRTGNRRFLLTNIYLRLDAAGQFIGTSKVRASFDLDGGLKTGGGTFETDVFDVDGSLIDSFGGDARASRIDVEPL